MGSIIPSRAVSNSHSDPRGSEWGISGEKVTPSIRPSPATASPLDPVAGRGRSDSKSSSVRPCDAATTDFAGWTILGELLYRETLSASQVSEREARKYTGPEGSDKACIRPRRVEVRADRPNLERQPGLASSGNPLACIPVPPLQRFELTPVKQETEPAPLVAFAHIHGADDFAHVEGDTETPIRLCHRDV